MLKIKKVKPMATRLVTTARVYTVDDADGTIIDAKQATGALKEYQEVIAVGDFVRGIKVGDLVKIDPSAYAVKKFKDGSLNDGVVQSNPVITYNFNMLEIDDKPCLLLQDRDIEYVVEKWFEEKKSNIVNLGKNIIL